MKKFTFSDLVSPEFNERIQNLKDSFTDEQLIFLKRLGTSVIVEVKDSDGTTSYSLMDKDGKDALKYENISKIEGAAHTNDGFSQIKNTNALSHQQIVRGIREKTSAPFKKLTELIADTACDYNAHSSETLIMFAKLGNRFPKDNAIATQIVDAILIFAESEAKMGVVRTVRQWYDTIIAITEKMLPEGYEKAQLKTKVLSLENQVRELTGKLNEAKEIYKYRINEIDKWHKLYEQAQSEISMWQSRYEKMKDADKKAEYKHQEILNLKHENAKLQEIVGQLKYQLEKDSMIVATARKYFGDSPLTPDVIRNSFANDDEYKKRERTFENKIKDLQEKLGRKTVPLSVLAKGLMDYAEEAGISEAHELFNHLNNMLISEPEWTNNVPGLKAFFKKARREMDNRHVTMTGEHATYNENKK